ncbi:putative small multi-drug export protein [Halalkalicoccus paucihalophilus]|uniref:Putative small multi-drug export protein n=1 Tax=Halalkalicoccus paucihalophilus TaxID=1008153 RepID=A0A151AIK9_9EURY|nr:small multi-drug export protein [Halalkalicoccus paucihalophilus]KYH27481.1 putative small multi-drug export protein [Halalkalicoccus paucihalophilus]
MGGASDPGQRLSWIAAVAGPLALATDPAAARSATDLFVETGGPVGYALVFLFAAIPWFEIFLVIPVGIGLGMNVVGVAVFAFLGNVLSVYAVIAFHDRARAWWARYRRTEPKPRERAGGRVRAVWDRYGLAGLAMSSPMVTGVHLAALIALALGSRKRAVGAWLTASIALWTVILTAVSYYGFGFVAGL